MTGGDSPDRQAPRPPGGRAMERRRQFLEERGLPIGDDAADDGADDAVGDAADNECDDDATDGER